MEILNLAVRVNETEINEQLAKLGLGGQQVRNLKFKILPSGIQISGEIHKLMLKLPFETLWTPVASGSTVEMRLENLKAAGLPANVLKSTMMKEIRDAVSEEAAVKVDDDKITVDIPALIQSRGLPLSGQVTAITCGEGSLVAEVKGELSIAALTAV